MVMREEANILEMAVHLMAEAIITEEIIITILSIKKMQKNLVRKVIFKMDTVRGLEYQPPFLAFIV